MLCATHAYTSVRLGPVCDEQRQAIACDDWIARALCRWILFAFTFDGSRSKFTRKFERVSLCMCVCVLTSIAFKIVCTCRWSNKRHKKCREYSKSNEKLVCKFIMFIVHITIGAGKNNNKRPTYQFRANIGRIHPGCCCMRTACVFRWLFDTRRPEQCGATKTTYLYRLSSVFCLIPLHNFLFIGWVYLHVDGRP